MILDEIEKNLKEGPAYYDIEEYTDQTLRQLAEETIREKILRFCKMRFHMVFMWKCKKCKNAQTKMEKICMT